jgi:hypothetical protein
MTKIGQVDDQEDRGERSDSGGRFDFVILWIGMIAIRSGGLLFRRSPTNVSGLP